MAQKSVKGAQEDMKPALVAITYVFFKNLYAEKMIKPLHIMSTYSAV